ncbi:MAG: VOC family protein [Thermoguttaceae bacterium]|nr:VOC family protein [Thermoguttaceae bacterium]
MKIDHIGVFVNDLKRARDFFMNYFGATSNDEYHNQKTGFRSFFLSFDDGARVEIMTRPDVVVEKNGDRPGRAHLAFGVGSRDKVDALTERLRADGYQVLGGPRVTGDGYYESCVAGPEGIVVEIVE